MVEGTHAERRKHGFQDSVREDRWRVFSKHFLFRFGLCPYRRDRDLFVLVAGLCYVSRVYLIVIFSVLHQVVLLGTNFVYLYAILTGKEAGRLIDYGFLAGANLVQLLEMGLLVILNLAIYQTLYG